MADGKSALETGQDMISLLAGGAVLEEGELFDLIYDTVEDLDDAAELIFALVSFVHGMAEGFGIEDLLPSITAMGMALAVDPSLLDNSDKGD